jgi:nucleoside-diphosphate-sugar epimerase
MEMKNNIKSILVTGGAGFLGINLCRYLVEKGYRVISLDIAEFTYPDMAGKVEVIKGDIRNADEVARAMQGIDIVVHCAAALPLYTREEIFGTDVGGTLNILKAADDLGVERVIFISSTAVYGIPDHHPLYENDRLVGVGPYGEAKILAEEKCLEYRQKKLCVPIIRPKSFIGPERLGVFAILYDWIRRGKNIPIVGSGKNRYQLLDVTDLCEAIDLCITKPRDIVNDTFNIGAGEFTTMKEDFGSVLDFAGYGKNIVGVPAKPLILLLRLLEFLHLSPLYRWVYETAAKDSFVSIDKAKKLLGFEPKYSNKETLIRNYQWYLAHYSEYQDTGVSHRAPWKQGVLAFVRFFF